MLASSSSARSWTSQAALDGSFRIAHMNCQVFNVIDPGFCDVDLTDRRQEYQEKEHRDVDRMKIQAQNIQKILSGTCCPMRRQSMNY